MQEFILTYTWQDALTLDYRSSSIFHGLLMENLSPDYATHLHHSQLAEFHLKLAFKKQEVRLIVWALTDRAKVEFNHLIERLANKQLLLKYKNLKLFPKTFIANPSESYYDWYLRLRKEPLPTYLLVSFHSPVSFKKQGQYVDQMDLKLIYQNLTRRLRQLQSTLAIEEYDSLIANSKIELRQVRKVEQPLQKVRIKAFQGECLIQITGTKEEQFLIYLLWSLAERYGIGMKTAMGMGNVELTPLYLKEAAKLPTND